MKHSTYERLAILVILLALMALLPAVALASPPNPEPPPGKPPLPPDPTRSAVRVKPIDQPNLKDFQRNRQRQRYMEAGETARANALALSGNDRVLVILVEFAGTDNFTWTAGSSTWDPIGLANSAEWTGTAGDCSRIITETRTFTYTGPMHNQIPRPLSAADASGTTIWTTDFSKQWFADFMFGNGVTINFNRVDGSSVYADFQGKSVRNYYRELSGNLYNISGDVIGWLALPHSVWWYGADTCPGARSTPTQGQVSHSGAIPGAGSARSLVRDALDAVNAISPTIPGFSWRNYDLDGDGIIDRLWIVHSGYGEEDNTTLLNRTEYREGTLWSHSSALTPAYPVGEGVSAGPYIMMPENGGIGVFAHEYGHNLGAMDLYAYGYGNTSAGFWTLMADDWTGFPIGFQPPAPDPYHLDNWGWLNPKVIVDPTQIYEVTLGQASPNTAVGASRAPAGMYRGAKIVLPTGYAPLSVQPWQGSYYWWGGKQDLTNGTMTLKNALALTGGAAATLSFDLAYDIEEEWDFLWVQVSTNGGSTWTTLTNANTICTHDPNWIGGLYGFPEDLCAAGIGGFSGHNFAFPSPETQTFDLTPFLGQTILLRFWYMTDWGTTGAGPFVDNVKIQVNSTVLLSDNAESGDAKWNYSAPWIRSNGTLAFTHNYYLQWRNVGTNGGYDSALGDSRWRYGPATTGLLVWYNNNFYSDNEIFNYLEEWPSFGPKGRMLVVDSHGEPYRDPARVLNYPNSISNLSSRGQMRDAPFNLTGTPNFLYPSLDTAGMTVAYAGRPPVSFFDDGYGYYPGLENARRGKDPCTTYQWYDKMWDTSAVLPGRTAYTTRALSSAFTTATGIRMMGSINPAGLCQASWYGYWYVPYAAGNNTGNPYDSNADYGWRVQIISQSPDGTSAVVKIWNTRYYGKFEPNKTLTYGNDTVNYTFSLHDFQGESPQPVAACVNLDTIRMEYVNGSSTATPGWSPPIPLSTMCPTTLFPAQLPRARSDAEVKAVAWVGQFTPGNFSFSYGTRMTRLGMAYQSINLYNSSGNIWAVLPAPPVQVNIWNNWLPFILR